MGDYSEKTNTILCQKDFMSIFISKQQNANLPFAIYVQGKLKEYILNYIFQFMVKVFCWIIFST